MIVTNTNYKDLLDFKYEFTPEDLIIFTIGDKTLEYCFTSRYLSNCNGWNDAIFDALDLDKIKFCTKSYGHIPQSGDFPECCKDFKRCLHRVTYDLFEECMKHCLPPAKSIKITDISIKLPGLC